MREEVELPFHIYTVTELTAQIRGYISSRFRDILVEGEVSGPKLYPSGHLYFTLKDDRSMINCVMFNCLERYPEAILKAGTALICRGRVDVYEKRGQYQLIVDAIEVKGLGLMQLKTLLLKERLLKEGLFDPERKRALPMLPTRIGIVTSPVGAAIRDMLKTIFNKFENMAVLIYPVRVQGEAAAEEIAEGVDYLSKKGKVDVIIVGRGGGSMEDLLAFNEEVVARAIYNSVVPVVSAVGHEIDFTIADLVADVRAATPTAAAEMVVKDKRELKRLLTLSEERLRQALSNIIARLKSRLYEHVIGLKERKEVFTDYRIYLDEMTGGLIRGFTLYLNERKLRLANLSQRLNDLNPYTVLERGYSIVLKADTNEVVSEAAQVERGTTLMVKLHKGELDCSVTEKREG